MPVTEEVRTSVLLICGARAFFFFFLLSPSLFPFPSELVIPEDAARMSGFRSKSNTPQRASEIARCPPSVSVTCQMPCHHHHHHSNGHQPLSESVCVCAWWRGHSFPCAVYMHDSTPALLCELFLFFVKSREGIHPLLLDQLFRSGGSAVGLLNSVPGSRTLTGLLLFCFLKLQFRGTSNARWVTICVQMRQ